MQPNKQSQKVKDAQKARLRDLLNLPGNKFCADCGEKAPRWSAAIKPDMCVFICYNCSGIHRSLGVHISFVRSTNLDDWTSEQVDRAETWGNERFNSVYEGRVGHARKPTQNSSPQERDMFIRAKYERKEFMAPDTTVTEREEKKKKKKSSKKDKGESPTALASTSQPTPARHAASKKAEPSLFDMDDPFSSPAPVASAAAVPASGGSAARPTQPSNVFDVNFTNGSMPDGNGGGMTPFQSGGSPQPQPANVTGLLDNISSMYGQQPQPQQQQQIYHTTPMMVAQPQPPVMMMAGQPPQMMQAQQPQTMMMMGQGGLNPYGGFMQQPQQQMTMGQPMQAQMMMMPAQASAQMQVPGGAMQQAQYGMGVQMSSLPPPSQVNAMSQGGATSNASGAGSNAFNGLGSFR